MGPKMPGPLPHWSCINQMWPISSSPSIIISLTNHQPGLHHRNRIYHWRTCGSSFHLTEILWYIHHMPRPNREAKTGGRVAILFLLELKCRESSLKSKSSESPSIWKTRGKINLDSILLISELIDTKGFLEELTQRHGLSDDEVH